MSRPLAAPGARWEQARLVRARLGGTSWHQAFTGPVPLPGWLVDIVDGHMDGYVGPEPVLFRTAGIGLEWFTAHDDHPDQLEVTCAHGRVDVVDLRTAADVIADAGGRVDADAYVWGDGTATGAVAVRIHRLFGVFPGTPSVRGLSDQLEGLHRFVTTIRVDGGSLVAQLMPRLPMAVGWA